MRYILAILFLGSFFLYGQTISNASSQGWAGGICCVYGTNYIVDFEIHEPVSQVELEKIYLVGYDNVSGSIVQILQEDGVAQYKISFGVSTNAYSITTEQSDVYTPTEQPEFDGSALILLTFDGKARELLIKEFTELPAIAYP